ncbi:hypothetical protein AAG570_000389 [Ranatra chinensis]|uniref:Lysosomal-associated transmembrane protein 4A n=1 Tax=Ranatra chinensis TaxID=642074 RepID=A0ABD0Z7B5_9HEMI
MVYGAIKGKPAYLMPFFCMQVFDFCIAGLSALSYLCYIPNMHHLVAENSQIPLQAQLLSLPPQCLSLLVLLTFVIAMLIKIYFIGVVWGCYKFLTLRIVSAQRTIQFIDTEFADSQGTLLPDYETALKFPTPPPSYASATAPATVTIQSHPDPSATASVSTSASATATTTTTATSAASQQLPQSA